MWSEDSGQPDHRPTQTLADPVGILVDVAAGWTELPRIRQANDKSPTSMWAVPQVDNRQIGYDEVSAGRREMARKSPVVWDRIARISRL
jgi:hypothetical protein